MLIRVTRILTLYPEPQFGSNVRILRPIAQVNVAVQHGTATIDLEPAAVMSVAKFDRHCAAGDFVLVGRDRRSFRR